MAGHFVLGTQTSLSMTRSSFRDTVPVCAVCRNGKQHSGDGSLAMRHSDVPGRSKRQLI